jgi:protein involved in polysaccharide export with SLBB domain
MKSKLVLRLLALSVITGALPLVAQTAAGRTQGDFEEGDQILLEVEGDTQFTHAFTVGPGPALTLPVIGAITLTGVRRTEVETYLGQQVGRYVKHPVVHAKVLVRIGVLGEVEHPGFYPLPTGAVMSDALMAAGGPTRDARFKDARIERDGKGFLTGNAFQDAVSRGMTIDGLGLRAGDRIVVPRQNDTERTVRIIGILVTLPIAIYGITRLGH